MMCRYEVKIILLSGTISNILPNLAQLKDNRHVKFSWMEDDADGERYFEFKLNVDELTGDVALLITDFAEEGEKEDAISLWDTQITELKQVLGL